MRAPVTNTAVGRAIGLSHAGVSRIRSGGRLPSLEAMLRIEAFFHWKIEDQVHAREQGTYVAEFEAVLHRWAPDVAAVTA